MFENEKNNRSSGLVVNGDRLRLDVGDEMLPEDDDEQDDVDSLRLLIKFVDEDNEDDADDDTIKRLFEMELFVLNKSSSVFKNKSVWLKSNWNNWLDVDEIGDVEEEDDDDDEDEEEDMPCCGWTSLRVRSLFLLNNLELLFVAVVFVFNGTCTLFESAEVSWTKWHLGPYGQ